MNKIEFLNKEIAEKQGELDKLMTETRSALDSDDKSVDDVKASMDHIDTIKADIEKLQSDLSVLNNATAAVEEHSDETNTDSDDAEESRDAEPSDEVDSTTIEDNDADLESRDMEGLNKMKKTIGTGADSAVMAFEKFLKTGEARDVTGISLKEGAVIIPETIMTPEHEQHQFPRLGSLVRRVSVSTTTGKLPVFMTSDDVLQAHNEYAPTDKGAAPEIQQILWDLKTFTGAYAFSQELMSDSSYNWQAELQARLVELRDNTDDQLIMSALTNGIKAVESTDLIADIKTALNLTLKPQDSQQSTIILSQSAYNALDQIKDGEGRPMLQPNIAQGTGYSFLGKTVVVIDDTLFPKAKVGDINAIVAPLQKAVINFKLTEITGQFQDTYDIWYKQLGIFLREDVVQARKDLIVNIHASAVAPATDTNTPAS